MMPNGCEHYPPPPLWKQVMMLGEKCKRLENKEADLCAVIKKLREQLHHATEALKLVKGS